jgi:hypothetical protein
MLIEGADVLHLMILNWRVFAIIRKAELTCSYSLRITQQQFSYMAIIGMCCRSVDSTFRSPKGKNMKKPSLILLLAALFLLFTLLQVAKPQSSTNVETHFRPER